MVAWLLLWLGDRHTFSVDMSQVHSHGPDILFVCFNRCKFLPQMCFSSHFRHTGWIGMTWGCRVSWQTKCSLPARCSQTCYCLQLLCPCYVYYEKKGIVVEFDGAKKAHLVGMSAASISFSVCVVLEEKPGRVSLHGFSSVFTWDLIKISCSSIHFLLHYRAAFELKLSWNRLDLSFYLI